MRTHHLFAAPTFFIFILIAILTLVQFPPSVRAADDERYINCSKTFSCAGISNIGYPFWGSTRADYCGHPDFKLSCGYEVLLLLTNYMTYRVLAINFNDARTLTVAREDYRNTICPPGRHANTSVDQSTLFSYTSDTTNLTLFYRCLSYTSDNTSSLLPTTDGFSFSCDGDDTRYTNYYSSSSLASTNNSIAKLCSNNVKVPAMKSVAESGTITGVAALQAAINGGFTLEWNANNSLCDRCEGSGGKCGFNTNGFACYCKSGYSPSTCESEGKKNGVIMLGVGIGIGLAGIPVVSFVIIYCVKRGYLSNNSMVWWKRDHAKNDHFTPEEILRNFGSMVPKRYNYLELKKLTNSFKNEVGQGGYGMVYKGELADGRIVAVKVLSESKGNGEDFINEVASISRTSHVNIVTLLGFCYEGTKRALIYEFMQNGSLDKFIIDNRSSITICQLAKKTKFQIAVGIARGLEYLHRGCRTRILHFDIKPQNILLDENFCPKISDFGLAKLCKTKESIVSMAGTRGTIGYIAPEVYSRYFGRVSHKSDVYSYGMLVLEMVAGRKNLDDGVLSHSSDKYFPNWIYDKLEKGETYNISGNINTDYHDQDNMIKRMIIVSLWCVQTNPSDRPSMDKVIEMLECNFQVPQFPPKPVFNSPTTSAQHSSISSTTTS